MTIFASIVDGLAIILVGAVGGVRFYIWMISRGWTVYQKKSESVRINHPIIRSMSADEFYNEAQRANTHHIVKDEYKFRGGICTSAPTEKEK